jgi:hypothetical protein
MRGTVVQQVTASSIGRHGFNHVSAGNCTCTKDSAATRTAGQTHKRGGAGSGEFVPQPFLPRVRADRYSLHIGIRASPIV